MSDFIGGEFWYDAQYRTDAVNVATQGMTFLNGGEAALRLICDSLISQGIRDILLPSYVCSTLADAFERYGVRYTFYRIREDFRIDLADLRQKAPSFKVLYVIDYFGYGFSDEEAAVFDQFKARRMLVIEDDAQAGFNRAARANVRFNSLRKLVPYDGSFFYSDRDMARNLEKFTGLANQRLPVIRQYRRGFADLIAAGAESFDVLNPLFEQSEAHYYADLVVLGDPDERSAAERLDWAAIEAARKANHGRLCERLAGVAGIEILFPHVSPHGPPLGFPIYVRDGRREALLDYLRERNVYPPVHWDVLADPRLNKMPETVGMSSKIITLLLDQRFSLDDMDYQAGVVRAFFGQ